MRLPPYGEKIVSDWLRAHEGVSAIVDRRVVGKTPDDTDAPWIRLTQLDAQSTGGPHHLEEGRDERGKHEEEAAEAESWESRGHISVPSRRPGAGGAGPAPST